MCTCRQLYEITSILEEAAYLKRKILGEDTNERRADTKISTIGESSC